MKGQIEEQEGNIEAAREAYNHGVSTCLHLSVPSPSVYPISPVRPICLSHITCLSHLSIPYHLSLAYIYPISICLSILSYPSVYLFYPINSILSICLSILSYQSVYPFYPIFLLYPSPIFNSADICSFKMFKVCLNLSHS